METYAGLTVTGDVWIEATLSTHGCSGINVPRLLLQTSAPPTFNGYEFAAMCGTPGFTSRIGTWVGGGFSLLTSENATTWVGGDVMLAEWQAGVLTLSRNGAVLLTVADSTFSGGRAGLLKYVNSALGDSEFDNVSIGIYGVVSTDPCGCDQH